MVRRQGRRIGPGTLSVPARGADPAAKLPEGDLVFLLLDTYRQLRHPLGFDEAELVSDSCGSEDRASYQQEGGSAGRVRRTETGHFGQKRSSKGSWTRSLAGREIHAQHLASLTDGVDAGLLHAASLGVRAIGQGLAVAQGRGAAPSAISESTGCC